MSGYQASPHPTHIPRSLKVLKVPSSQILVTPLEHRISWRHSRLPTGLGLSPPATRCDAIQISLQMQNHSIKGGSQPTPRCCLLECVALLLLARAASRLHHARPPFFLPRGVSRSSLLPLRSFLSPPSLSCPMRITGVVRVLQSEKEMLSYSDSRPCAIVTQRATNPICPR